MMSKAVLLACSLHAMATSVVFFKANAKRLFEIDLHPIVWWLITGWLLESLYLNAWWNLSEATSPWSAQIMLAAVGTMASVMWMSAFYGFHIKYVFAACLILSGVAVSQMST